MVESLSSMHDALHLIYSMHVCMYPACAHHTHRKKIKVSVDCVEEKRNLRIVGRNMNLKLRCKKYGSSSGILK